MNRREFLTTTTTSLAGLGIGSHAQADQEPTKKLALGFDNFSIRALKWKAPKLIEYAAGQKVDTLLFSDLDVYESHEASYLGEIKAQATDAGIVLQAGTGSICGTSSRFDDKHGTDIEHLKLTIKIARQVGSDVARCYLGNARDRKSEGGLQPHIDRVVDVCKAVESYAKDQGVKIAIENHAGDMTAWQLKQLIERAGPDYVGATIDAGNATFTLEDPVENLRILGPYVLSSGIRDSAVWAYGEGVRVEWVPMGKGVVDWKSYFKLWRQLCPEAPVQLETMRFGKSFPPKADENFWKDYQDIREVDYAAFLKLAEGGTAAPKKTGDQSAEEVMMEDLEISLQYCREDLGLGIKA